MINTDMITLTVSAQDKVAKVLANEIPNSRLRLYVSGKGCAGMTYGFAVAEELEEGDTEIQSGPVVVVIDPESMPYLKGSIVDFKEDLTGSRFAIINPNAKSSCGCGDSFQPYT